MGRAYIIRSDRLMHTLIFDRLQNSVLNLEKLQDIPNVFVEQDSPFDHTVMCQHIIGNAHKVNLRVGDKQGYCTVSFFPGHPSFNHVELTFDQEE